MSKGRKIEWWEYLFAVIIALVLLVVVLEYIVPAKAQSNMGPSFPIYDPMDTTPSPYASSHPKPGQPDPYLNARNADTGWGCCGGRDCMEVDVTKPEELARMTEDADEVVLDGKWHFPKKGSLPSFNGNYHFCIWGGKPRCLYIPTSS